MAAIEMIKVETVLAIALKWITTDVGQLQLDQRY